MSTNGIIHNESQFNLRFYYYYSKNSNINLSIERVNCVFFCALWSRTHHRMKLSREDTNEIEKWKKKIKSCEIIINCILSTCFVNNLKKRRVNDLSLSLSFYQFNLNCVHIHKFAHTHNSIREGIIKKKEIQIGPKTFFESHNKKCGFVSNLTLNYHWNED